MEQACDSCRELKKVIECARCQRVTCSSCLPIDVEKKSLLASPCTCRTTFNRLQLAAAFGLEFIQGPYRAKIMESLQSPQDRFVHERRRYRAMRKDLTAARETVTKLEESLEQQKGVLTRLKRSRDEMDDNDDRSVCIMPHEHHSPCTGQLEFWRRLMVDPQLVHRISRDVNIVRKLSVRDVKHCLEALFHHEDPSRGPPAMMSIVSSWMTNYYVSLEMFRDALRSLTTPSLQSLIWEPNHAYQRLTQRELAGYATAVLNCYFGKLRAWFQAFYVRCCTPSTCMQAFFVRMYRSYYAWARRCVDTANGALATVRSLFPGSIIPSIDFDVYFPRPGALPQHLGFRTLCDI